MARKSKPPAHPMQPVVLDPDGVARFHPNAIVRFLVDWGRNKGMGLNDLALIPFSNEDRCQLAQLIGYSVSGYGELSYTLGDPHYLEAQEQAEKLTKSAK